MARGRAKGAPSLKPSESPTIKQSDEVRNPFATRLGGTVGSRCPGLRSIVCLLASLRGAALPALDQRLAGLSRDPRIGVPMDKLPALVPPAKDAGDAQGDIAELLTPAELDGRPFTQKHSLALTSKVVAALSRR